MKEGNRNPKLFIEERKAIILFLWLFYIVYYSFEIFYYLSKSTIYKEKDLISTSMVSLGLFLVVLIFGVYFIKKGNPFIVKYIYIYSYLGIDLVDTLLTYWGKDIPYTSGNIVEVLFFLYSPIFVNKRFFWLVSLGLIGKEVILGLILQSMNVLMPIVIYIILSLIAYTVLIRFNSYIKSITAVYEELRHKEKLAVIGQMAAGIGHEIRNPLSSLKGFAQLQHERSPNSNEFYPIMIQEIDRINSIVNDLMYLGKPKEINFEKARIEEIIAYTLSITQQQAEMQGVKIETFMEGPLPPIECDGKQLKQVFLNLIKNAIESMVDGGRIKINVKTVSSKKMYISIQDEGCGIEDSNILNLGEPFFTTKKDGTGLGLMVTNQIIKDHNGKLKIESVIGEGTEVKVSLPIMQKNQIKK
ncbi:ATP-binding protein [Neobacillus drentensis]|uniref:ATP-binding protein n=1 Tax=Neobacillus drentensis TaxID=220684 RepID=UPI001F18D5D0|nr:ATP-binding protein [Neobacillus drentensis]ULT57813.1 ATP-binding protein [Neobacillus drentensis]